MKIFLFLALAMLLRAEPLRVPQQFYSGFGKNGNHPGHAPLITDVTYRSISDHIIDQDAEWFDPQLVRLGDIIYLNAWYLEWFEKEVHDRIPFPYILITCDVGDWLPNPSLQRLLYDPKLATWFCRNIAFSYHPKLIQIAMGQNDRLFPDAPLRYLTELAAKSPFHKEIFLYMNHLPRTYGDRDKIVKLFEKEPYCFSRNRSDQVYGQITRERYFDELASAQFVISPFGLESDCVRTWEALALQCIPVVEHSFFDPLFDDLPVIFVHEWTEVNEAFLKQKYEQLQNRTWEKAFFPYWQELIEKTQASLRREDLFFSQLEATQFDPEYLADLIAILKEHGEPSSLIYRGFVSAIHALQLANEAPFLSRIQLCDPWLDQKTLRSFSSYLKDLSLLENQRKLSLLSFKVFDSVFPILAKKKAPIFLDFSYHRNSLMRDSTLKKFRHSLRNDLTDLYQEAAIGTLICGNMIRSEYVREVLERVAKEKHFDIKTKGDFWYFVKYKDS